MPGGVLVVIDSGDATVASRVLLRQHGRNMKVRLTLVDGVRPCAEFYGAEPFVDWPRIGIFGCTGSKPDKAVTWLSQDGGKTWQVYRS